MKEKIIVGLVGEMAAGKTTVTNYLKEKYGAVSVRFSDMLFDILKRLHIEPSRTNLQKLSTVVRQTFGEDIMSKVIAHDVAKMEAQFIITEGVRRPSDVTYLRELPGYRLISLTAGERARFDRTRNRSEKTDDQTKTWREFQTEGQQESEQLIKAIAAQANFTVDNNGTLAQLFAQVDEVVSKIRQ